MGSNDQITIIGIAVTFVVSVANLVYSLRNNNRTIFVNTVTASRLKWINSLRDKVSEFIAVSARLSGLPSPDDPQGLILQRDILLNQIALHLNPLDAEDQSIKMQIDHVRELTERGNSKDEIPAELTKLRDATGNYLKKEWNRVKNESEGRPL